MLFATGSREPLSRRSWFDARTEQMVRRIAGADGSSRAGSATSGGTKRLGGDEAVRVP